MGLIVDCFAGGGGASAGIEAAMGRPIDIAINHDPEAIAMHKLNHPRTRHLCQNIWQVDPSEATGGEPVDLAWFSPDCKHFSKAKGGRPVKRSIRDLAWVVVLWAKRTRPSVICLENVEEFRDWGPLTAEGKPCPVRKGKTFNAWVWELKRLGYKIEWRQLRACDFGAPTIRRRLFMIARCDGIKIEWPEPTHGKGHGLQPYRTAAEIIEWNRPCHSIFLTPEEAKEVGVKRPLAEATMRRIAQGVQRYVIDAAEPFIVTANHGGDHFRGQSLDEPFKTVPAARDAHGVVTPVLAPFTTGVGGRAAQSRPRGVDEPTATGTAKADRAIVVPTLIQTGYGERKGQAPRVPGLEKPLGTVVAGGSKHALVAAFLAQHNTGVVGHHAEEPVSTIVGKRCTQGLVATHLIRHFGRSVGQPTDEPAPTITAGGGGKTGIITSHLIHMKGESKPGKTPRPGKPVTEPTPTICAEGFHLGEVRAFLIKYFGTAIGQGLDEPLHTATSKPRFGLVTIEGEDYQIVDICMRMLAPSELFAAQGFPPEYEIEPEIDGKPLSKTAQTRCVGNSVSPPVPEAMIRCCFPDAAPLREAA